MNLVAPGRNVAAAVTMLLLLQTVLRASVLVKRRCEFWVDFAGLRQVRVQSAGGELWDD